LREMIAAVRRAQRQPTYKFTYSDYIAHILLGPYLSKYARVDQASVSPCCCTIC
jgi:hypothetical protein